MTGTLDESIGQAFFDNEGGLAIVGSTASNFNQRAQWEAVLAPFLRLDAFRNTVPPLTALSYFELGSGEVAVLYRHRTSEHSDNRNPSMALIGSEQVLTVSAALELFRAGFFSDRRYNDIDSIQPIPANSLTHYCNDGRGSLRNEARLESGLLRHLVAAMLASPPAAISAIGFDDASVPALIWAANEITNSYDAHFFGARVRPLTFSTYEVNEPDADRLGLVFLPGLKNDARAPRRATITARQPAPVRAEVTTYAGNLVGWFFADPRPPMPSPPWSVEPVEGGPIERSDVTEEVPRQWQAQDERASVGKPGRAASHRAWAGRSASPPPAAAEQRPPAVVPPPSADLPSAGRDKGPPASQHDLAAFLRSDNFDSLTAALEAVGRHITTSRDRWSFRQAAEMNVDQMVVSAAMASPTSLKQRITIYHRLNELLFGAELADLAQDRSAKELAERMIATVRDDTYVDQLLHEINIGPQDIEDFQQGIALRYLTLHGLRGRGEWLAAKEPPSRPRAATPRLHVSGNRAEQAILAAVLLVVLVLTFVFGRLSAPTRAASLTGNDESATSATGTPSSPPVPPSPSPTPTTTQADPVVAPGVPVKKVPDQQVVYVLARQQQTRIVTFVVDCQQPGQDPTVWQCPTVAGGQNLVYVASNPQRKEAVRTAGPIQLNADQEVPAGLTKLTPG